MNRDIRDGDARSLPADALERLRRQVVAAVESGFPHEQAARVFGVSRKTVGTWVRTYQAGGEQALQPRRRGRRAGDRLALSAAQQAWVVKTVASGPPDDLGLPCLLWTRRAVAELIRGKFSIALSTATIDQYLSRWDLITESRPPAAEPDAALWVAWTCPRPVTSPARLNALVARTNRGVLLFLVSERPFDRERLTDFRKRLRVQLARDVRVVVRGWPGAQAELLDCWQHDD
ncbi:helix-turn-helix domain-containing protein [Amycolatopsis nigrescens]|uniref:helix-turn-helix domain-containing protein n=1 Tax=Amycolatopsis nigrescens TaxID=381445 RepID=UPI000374B587|nr:helix-turn-helix domain-containing protein [Amycolatopsis nigrescens]